MVLFYQARCLSGEILIILLLLDTHNPPESPNSTEKPEIDFGQAGMIQAPPSQQRRLAFAYIVVPRMTKGTMGTALVDTRHKHTTSSFLFFSS